MVFSDSYFKTKGMIINLPPHTKRIKIESYMINVSFGDIKIGGLFMHNFKWFKKTGKNEAVRFKRNTLTDQFMEQDPVKICEFDKKDLKV